MDSQISNVLKFKKELNTIIKYSKYSKKSKKIY